MTSPPPSRIALRDEIERFRHRFGQQRDVGGDPARDVVDGDQDPLRAVAAVKLAGQQDRPVVGKFQPAMLGGGDGLVETGGEVRWLDPGRDEPVGGGVGGRRDLVVGDRRERQQQRECGRVSRSSMIGMNRSTMPRPTASRSIAGTPRIVEPTISASSGSSERERSARDCHEGVDDRRGSRAFRRCTPGQVQRLGDVEPARLARLGGALPLLCLAAATHGAHGDQSARSG